MSARLLAAWHHRPTQRKVWALAAPMILSNLSVPLVSLVDSTVAGHLPHAEQLAAVSIGGAVFTALAWIFGFMRMGTTGFAAQAAGRTDGGQLRAVLLQSLLLAVVLSGLLLALAWPLMPWLLERMDATPNLHSMTLAYLHIRLPALPAVLANYALTGWFLGKQNARMAMGMLLVTNAINIALNLYFVLGLGWAIEGIALASACAAYGGMLFGLAGVSRQLRGIAGHLAWPQLRRWHSWQALLAVNRDIFVRSLALQAVFLAMTVLGTRLGGDVVAANALLLNGLMLTSFALDGLANAVEAMSGHAIGAGDRDALYRTLVVAGGWSLLGSLAFALAFTFGGHLFINLQTSMPRVREVAWASLPWLAMLPLVAVSSYLLDGLFVGATRAREMRDSMLVAGLVFGLLCWLLRPFGNTGLWLALLGFMAIRGVCLAWLARRIHVRHAWVLPLRQSATFVPSPDSVER